MTSGYFAQHLFRSWRHHFTLQVLTIVVLSIVLVAMAMILSLRENLSHMTALWGDNLELTIYLKDKSPKDAVTQFLRQLQGDQEFAEVRFVDSDQAMRRFTTRMGAMAPGFLKTGEIENPLPASIEIKLKDETSATEKVSALRTLAGRYNHNPLVDDVAYGQGWIENWAGFLNSIQVLTYFAGLMTVILGLLIVGNSVRVSVSQRREEIEILELIGATQRFIRFPLIAEGALTGLVASLMAGVIGNFLQVLLFDYLKSNLTFWSVLQQIQPLSGWGWLGITVIGTCFGAFGAYFCVRRLNSGWSASE